MLTLDIGQAALIALGQVGGPVHRHYLATLARVDAGAKAYLSGGMLKVRTGNLRSSMRGPYITFTAGRLSGVLENVASYALALHEGSKAHEIRPVRKQALRFAGRDGQPVFAMVVQHPGTKPKPFMRQALYDVIESSRI